MSDDPTASIMAAIHALETGLRAEITDMRTGITDIRAEISDTRTGVIDMRAEISDMRTGVTDMRAEIFDMRTGVTDMRAGITEMRVGIMERIDRLQDAVSGMRDDVAVNFAHADRVNERANGIERELSAIQRQIQRLQSDVRSLKGEPWVSADVKLQTGLVDRTGTTQAGASGGGRV